MNSVLRVLVVLAVALVLCFPSPASADEPTGVRPEQNVQAVLVGRAALEAYHRADWTTAQEAFLRAEAISHSPVFMLFIARCRRNLGAWLEARELYRRVASEQLSDGVPEPWRVAVRDAAQELEELTARIPSIVIVPENAPANATITVDGKVVQARDLGLQIQVDPGLHRVTGTDPVGAAVEVEVRVDPSEHARRVALRFPGPRSEVPLPPPVRTPTTSGSPKPPPAHPTRRAAYVSGALGLVGLAVGTVAGVVALAKSNALKDRCQGNLCLGSERADADAIRPYATVSTLGFAVGGVALATGTVLLALDPPWAHAVGRQRTPAPFVAQVRASF
jgi:hypothetical protein